ncbi:hypothetical protein L3Q82_005355 [Scortum barcoo]|uniref:Uncharacterized protein n=1 Tax=Scortum barcoo TaxID=214431 RepID=A0ACB8V9S7_9TELE|nr:hypothetical protein L3Q82_005355 [Scortum barcoo]
MSCLVPVLKKSRPSDPADYRPVALTSHVMKVLERLVLAQLRTTGHSLSVWAVSLSDVVVSDTGAPQGTVLSPFLFTLYTTDFQYNSESCHLQKFSDDSAVVGCIREGEEGEYRTLVDNFVEWSKWNHLRLNVNKTREMVIDFRRKKMPSQPLRIRGEVVDEVEDYKYLGVGDRQQTGLEI